MRNPMHDRDGGMCPGGEGKDTCDHGLSRRSMSVKSVARWAKSDGKRGRQRISESVV